MNKLSYESYDVSLWLSLSKDDFNWYRARCRDGKVGMIPSNYVKERGEYTLEAEIAPQAPLKAEAGTTDVPDQDSLVTAKTDNQGDVELSDMQVWHIIIVTS